MSLRPTGGEGDGWAHEAELAERALKVRLFGRMRIECDGVPVEATAAGRSRELLCYLLLHRRKSHSRECVASVLWGDRCTTKQAKTYLRKALWQLQSDLQAEVGAAGDFIVADAEWIRIGPAPALRLDVATLEEAHARFRDVPGDQFTEAEAQTLRAAVDAYTGDLLEGWYQEWCLIERARLQRVYLLLVDKLMAHCERAGAYETGLAYGEQSLRYDRARERTYRQLIRLHTALGDRTGALRAYDRCETALREELATRPASETVALADAVRGAAAGAHPSARDPEVPVEATTVLAAPDVSERLERLAGLQRQLADVQARVCDEVDALRQMLWQGAACRAAAPRESGNRVAEASGPPTSAA